MNKTTRLLFLCGCVILAIDLVIFYVISDNVNSFFLLTGIIPTAICWMTAIKRCNNKQSEQ